MLQEHDGALSFTTDVWMSPNHKVFIAVTVHFENNGVPICMILNIVEVAMSHLGVNLAAAFADILQEFGVSDKVSFNERTLEKILTCILQILCITCDNTSPNDTMIDELGNLIISFPGDANHAWCFNHVVILIVKSSIHQFDVPKGKADVVLDEAKRELRELMEGLDIEEEEMVGEWEVLEDDDDENTDGWIDEVASLSVADREELDANIRPIRLVLVKVSH